MHGISEYINSELAETSAKLRITDYASVLHTCSTDGKADGGSDIYPSKPTFLHALPCPGLQSIRTGQLLTVQTAGQGWTDCSPLHEIDILRVLTMRLRPVKAKRKRGRLNIKRT